MSSRRMAAPVGLRLPRSQLAAGTEGRYIIGGQASLLLPFLVRDLPFSRSCGELRLATRLVADRFEIKRLILTHY
jgi:hypothetical protein